MTTPALADSPAKSILKVVNNKRVAGVDNGWVVFESGPLSGAVRRHVLNPDGSLTKGATQKFKTAGQGPVNQGAFFFINGVTFAPCPSAPKPILCGDVGGGMEGVGLAFGQLNFGGSGGQIGGYVTDQTVKTQFTNLDSNPGGIAAVGVGPGGAYAVGYDQSLIPGQGFRNHAVVLALDAASQTYQVIQKTDLGTVGGNDSRALNISRGANFIVGVSEDADQKNRAVYTPSGGASWINIAVHFPPDVKSSRAYAANDNGLILGTGTVERPLPPDIQKKNTEIGFIFDSTNNDVTWFEAPGYNVLPQRILADGTVVGQLQALNSGTPPSYSPFYFDGVTVHNFDTMILPSTGLPAYGCRVEGTNEHGEMVGSCIAAGGAYGKDGTAFYINGKAPAPSFVNVHEALQANAAPTNSFVKQYNFGTAVSIDDRHTIGLNGAKKTTGAVAGFIATKEAYNP